MIRELLANAPLCESIDEAALRARGAEVTKVLMRASNVLEIIVANEAQKVDQTTPWVTGPICNVYSVCVEAKFRIVNLVASQARSNLNSGITLAIQNTKSGEAIELRRAKHLDSPNLVELLLELPVGWFVSRGGHPMACGATIREGYMEKVLSELQRLLQIECSREN